MQQIQRRTFSSLVSYSNSANPRAFITVASGDKTVGKIVFELYADKQASAVDNFQALVDGSASDGRSYVGTTFASGMAGLGVRAGKTCEEGLGAWGVFNTDGDLSLRHHKRGMLSYVTHGDQQIGSEFTMTFGAAPTLDGYQTVFAEMVEGDSVLAEIEAATDRHGQVNQEFKVVEAGML